MTTRKNLEDDSYRDARELNDKAKQNSLDDEILKWNKRNKGKKDPLTGMDLVKRKRKFQRDPSTSANEA